jgi:hypothetical protein
MTKLTALSPSGLRDVCDVHYVNEQRVKAVQKAMIGDEVAEAPRRDVQSPERPHKSKDSLCAL